MYNQNSIDQIYRQLIWLKASIGKKDFEVIEHIIDGFGNTAMSTCLNIFGEESNFYKDLQKIYGEVLLGVHEKNNQRILETTILIRNFIIKLNHLNL